MTSHHHSKTQPRDGYGQFAQKERREGPSIVSGTPESRTPKPSTRDRWLEPRPDPATLPSWGINSRRNHEKWAKKSYWFRHRGDGSRCGMYDPHYHLPVDLTGLTQLEFDENQEATFETYVRPRSAAQLVDFWTTVPIPEGAVRDFMVSFDTWRKRIVVDPKVSGYLGGQSSMLSIPPPAGTYPPHDMDASTARIVIRAYGIHRGAESLPDNEAVFARAQPFELPDGAVFSAEDAAAWYGCEHYWTGFFPS